MVAKKMIPPSSVYRLQFNKDFGLKNAIDLLSYLNELGIEGIYCSPFYEYSSENPYEIVNPNQIDPRIGTPEDFEQFCVRLKALGIQLFLDVVPNHMGIKEGKNPWWQDVMEKGEESPFAEFFDIDWQSEVSGLAHKVLLPILAANQESIHLTSQKNQLEIECNDYRFPLSIEGYRFIQQNAQTEKEALTFFNNNQTKMQELLNKQFYCLDTWKASGNKINYRRFFNINELAAIRIENEKVIQAHHAFLFDLLSADKVQGIRIDHVDGLYDPEHYFERIQTAYPTILIIEKILNFQENIPSTWKVNGTVGYESLNIINGLFIDKKNEHSLTTLYENFIQEKPSFKKILHERRKKFVETHMQSEINLISSIFYRSIPHSIFTKQELTRTLTNIIIHFPVYRTYIKPGVKIDPQDQSYILEAIEGAKVNSRESPPLYDFIKNTFLKADNPFILRFQRMTAPVMAKGLEDSAFYIYNRLISLNEVGSNPENFGFSKNIFYKFCKNQLIKMPYSFLPSSTDDTKYSQDVRMRLNVLSEMPEKWNRAIYLLQKIYQKYKTKINDALWPDQNLEYYIYQMLLGMNLENSQSFEDRMTSSLQKIIREAGIYTSWLNPNEDYEKTAKIFLVHILKDNAPLLEFQNEITAAGYYNSLASLILKVGMPGIFDLYQGDEWWNFSLVDPDNRRSVDYPKHRINLANSESIQKLLSQLDHGKIKLHLTSKALHFRKKHKDLFLKGNFNPISTSTEHVIAFSRSLNGQLVLVLARRFFTKELEKNAYAVLPEEGIFIDCLTENVFKTQKKDRQIFLNLSSLFELLPCALLLKLPE